MPKSAVIVEKNKTYRTLPVKKKTHPHSILQVPTTQVEKMSIDPKFVELTADVLNLFFK